MIMLEDLAGLSSLETVGGELNLIDNEVLASLNGLQSLQTAGGGIQVSMHPLLTNLDAIAGLTAIGSNDANADLMIYDNATLPYCEICEVLSNLSTQPTTDELSIDGNLPDACAESAISPTLNCSP